MFYALFWERALNSLSAARAKWAKNKALLGGFSDATGQKRKEVGGLPGFQAWQFFR